MARAVGRRLYDRSGADAEGVPERGVERHELVGVERADPLREPAFRDRLQRITVGHGSDPKTLLAPERDLARDAADRLL